GFINFGRTVRWKQSMDARVSLQRYGPWLKPTLSWTSNYAQNNGPELSSDLSVRAIANGQNLTVSWDFPVHQPRRGGGADTSRKLGWRRVASRLGTVSTDFGYVTNASESRITGTPSLLYMFGLAKDPGLEADTTGRVRQQFGNRSEDGQEWHAGART